MAVKGLIAKSLLTHHYVMIVFHCVVILIIKPGIITDVLT